MILVFLADGFEEVEALATVDLLRRANLEVMTVGIGGKTVRGSHGISVIADTDDTAFSLETAEAIVLPGGIPGTPHLEESDAVQKAIDFAAANDRWIAAICAAPTILGHKGLLKGKRATCYPGCETELIGANPVSDGAVIDGKIITGKSAGNAIPFALALVAALKSEADAKELGASLQC